MKNGHQEEATTMLPAANANLQKMQITPAGTKTKSWYGVRHTQMILLFVMIAIAYGMRVNMSIGIVAMTDSTINPDFPTYNWTIKSTILSSFFMGYILPQIAVGQLAEKYGAKYLITGAMTVSSLFTILIPFMAQLGVWAVIICRGVQGFTQGFFYPSMHHLLSRWIPLEERSRMGTFIYAGGPLGLVIAMPVTGWICASPIGWPSVFYIYGSIGLLWTAVWLWIGSNDPSQHKTISEEERMYIQKFYRKKTESDKKTPTPWLQIVKSMPVWAIIVSHCGQAWGATTLMTEIPIYTNYILKFNIKDNGLLSAAPYLTLWIMSFIYSYLTDMVINKKICSVGVARKVVTAIGFFGPAITLFCLGKMESTQKEIIIILLIITQGVKSATYCGYQVNHIDIAPSHAGTLMGITNSAANVFSMLAPLLVEVVVKDETNPEEWKIVFYFAASVYAGCCFIFIIFGKGEIQDWDKLDSSNHEEVQLNEKGEERENTEKHKE